MNRESITISSGPKLRTAMMLAIAADLFQIVIFPLVMEGAPSPVDDALDVGVAVMLTAMLGWHWEFLPSFLAKITPGVDLVPFWTLAVANVYRRNKKLVAEMEGLTQNTQTQRA
jgi:hypothetical protein